MLQPKANIHQDEISVLIPNINLGSCFAGDDNCGDVLIKSLSFEMLSLQTLTNLKGKVYIRVTKR